MKEQSLSPLALVLARPIYTESLDVLANAFFDRTSYFRLNIGTSRAPVEFGAHLRRSFLGALGPSASDAARNNASCPWDPPCALDVFCREQLRGPRGDGLPKPYVLSWTQRGSDLIVGLRVFGMANDWSMAATDAMAVGLRNILPWPKVIGVVGASPKIIDRWFKDGALPVCPKHHDALAVTFVSPVDITGSDPFAAPHKLLSRLVRRVDGVSRWSGHALNDDAGRACARHAATLVYDVSEMSRDRYNSPNSKRQARVSPTVKGRLIIQGDWAPIWPILAMGTRCHVGRRAVEGLGRISVQSA